MSFCFADSPDAEAKVKNLLNFIAGQLDAASFLTGKIAAVVLGGGYGRGEGGATPDGQLYNDLDFFIINCRGVKKNIYADFFRKLSRECEAKVNIDVDFFSAGDKTVFYRDADTLMLQELFAGGVVVWGDQKIFADAPQIKFNELAWTEGARLLLNRGTGLLLARQRLHDSAQLEFIRRNYYKAALGCGDAWLIARHLYTAKSIDRHTLLVNSLPPGAPLADFYTEALRYKYHPDPAQIPSLASLSHELPQQLELFYQALSDYAQVVVGRRDATLPQLIAAASGGKNKGKNFLRNLRYCGLGGKYWLPLTVHPRLKLLQMLVEVLQQPNAALERRYLAWWQKLN